MSKYGNKNVLGSISGIGSIWKRIAYKEFVEPTIASTDGTNPDELGDTGNGFDHIWAQSFTLTETTSINGVALEFGATTGAPTGTVTVRIETHGSGEPSGTLAHANFTTAITPTASSWNQWNYTETSLAAGTYWIVPAIAAQAGGNYWTMISNPSGTFTGGQGQHSKDNGVSWEADVPLRDFNFKLYTSDNRTTSYTFSNLDGDSESFYKFRFHIVAGVSATTFYDLLINGDNTGPYGVQALYNSAPTVITAVRATGELGINVLSSTGIGNVGYGEVIINTKNNRATLGARVARVTGTTVGRILIGGYSYTDTVTNLTSLELLSSQTLGIDIGSKLEIWSKI